MLLWGSSRGFPTRPLGGSDRCTSDNNNNNNNSDSSCSKRAWSVGQQRVETFYLGGGWQTNAVAVVEVSSFAFTE